MAIYHLTAKTGSRSGGQSARAKADYIQREGKYARDMDEVLHAESGHMPEFVERPADYWDAADLYERANGRLFKEVEFALPVELTLDQQKALASEFAQRQTGAAWVELAKELREVAAEVSSAAQSARSASRGWHWKLWLTVMLASMMPTVVLLIASLLLLDLTPLTTEDGSIWLRLVAR